MFWRVDDKMYNVEELAVARSMFSRMEARSGGMIEDKWYMAMSCKGADVDRRATSSGDNARIHLRQFDSVWTAAESSFTSSTRMETIGGSLLEASPYDKSNIRNSAANARPHISVRLRTCRRRGQLPSALKASQVG